MVSTTARSATARPNIPTPTGRSMRADPVPAAPAADAGVVGEAQVAGRRVDEVDHRAVGIEQAGGLVDGGLEQLVDLADAAVGVGTGRRRPRPRRLGGRRPCRRSRPDPGTRWRPRDARAVPWSESSRAEDTPASAKGGIAVRRWRLRHPAEAATVAATRRRPDRRLRRFAVPCPPCAAVRPADHATCTPAHQPGTTKSSEVHHPDVRHPHHAPPRRRRRPRRHRRPRPGHRLHPLHPRRPAVHAERRRLPRRRRRDDRPARPRRPLPLDRPRRPHRLRRDRHRRLGRRWARTSAPPTSPRPSRSP